MPWVPISVGRKGKPRLLYSEMFPVLECTACVRTAVRYISPSALLAVANALILRRHGSGVKSGQLVSKAICLSGTIQHGRLTTSFWGSSIAPCLQVCYVRGGWFWREGFSGRLDEDVGEVCAVVK